MKKGVIMDVDEHYVTMMTPEGEFMRTRKLQQEYQVGEEIHFYPLESGGVNGKTKVLPFLNSLRGRAIVLAAAIIFLTATLLPNYESRQVYAYMSIDVNPSIELGLNEELNVITMEGYNEDGKKVVTNVTNWKNQSAVIVTEKVIIEIENQGFLNEEKRVLIATVPSTGPKMEEDEVVLAAALTEIKKATQDEEVDVTVVNGTAKERETAVQQGVTTGIYKQGKLEDTRVKEKQQESHNNSQKEVSGNSRSENTKNDRESNKHNQKEMNNNPGLGNNNPGQSKKQNGNIESKTQGNQLNGKSQKNNGYKNGTIEKNNNNSNNNKKETQPGSNGNGNNKVKDNQKWKNENYTQKDKQLQPKKGTENNKRDNKANGNADGKEKE